MIDKYEQTLVSAINSGIAGDTIYGMQKRLKRDIIRYQPDLLIINACLNLDKNCGDTSRYGNILLQIVRKIKTETEADIIMMTPNKAIEGENANPNSPLEERVAVIRAAAEEEQVCLADTYQIWEQYERQGYSIRELLANGVNHPSSTGHEVYARVLMQLFE